MGWSVPYKLFKNAEEAANYYVNNFNSENYIIVDNYLVSVAPNENGDFSKLYFLVSPKNDLSKVDVAGVLIDLGVNGSCGFKEMCFNDIISSSDMSPDFVTRITEITLAQSSHWLKCIKDEQTLNRSIKTATKRFWKFLMHGDQATINSGYTVEYIGKNSQGNIFKILDLNGSVEHKFYNKSVNLEVTEFSYYIKNNLSEIQNSYKAYKNLLKLIQVGTKLKIVSGVILSCYHIEKGNKFYCEILDSTGNQNIKNGEKFIFNDFHLYKASLV